MAHFESSRGARMTDEEVRELKVDESVWIDYYHNYSKTPNIPAVSGAFKILRRGQDCLEYGHGAYIDLRKSNLTQERDGRSEFYKVEVTIVRPANTPNQLIELLRHALSVMSNESCGTEPAFHFEQYTGKLDNPDWEGTLKLKDEGKQKIFQLVIKQLTDWEPV